MPTAAERRDFIAAHTAIETPPLVPEIRLHLGSDSLSIWEASEKFLKQKVPPPFWAFCWPGGQVLARHIIDHPEIVRGKRILDFAAGGGVSAIAASRAGAAVVASEIDEFAVEVLALNGALNDAKFEVTSRDLIGKDEGWDVVFAGDVCYEQPVAERIVAWLRKLAARGALVLMGDPGRTYLPRERLEAVVTYVVPTSLDLEDRTQRETTVWKLLP